MISITEGVAASYPSPEELSSSEDSVYTQILAHILLHILLHILWYDTDIHTIMFQSCLTALVEYISKVHSPGVTVRIGIAITSFLCPYTTVLQGTPGAYTALAFANYISHHGRQLPQI